jgi:glycosyltransferase involved in cell wall biosynthesis
MCSTFLIRLFHVLSLTFPHANMMNVNVPDVSGMKSATPSIRERQLSFSAKGLASLPEQPFQKLGVLLSTEYEGLGRNGGVGTYYRELASALSSAGWTTLLVLLGGFLRDDHHVPPASVDGIIDLTQVGELLDLQPVHRAMLQGTKSDPNQTTGLSCLFLLQALQAHYPRCHIYAEFHEMFGFGYLSAKARRAGVLGGRVSIGVTMHSGHEWIYDANRAILDQPNQPFLRIAAREEQSFFDATLPMYPSDSLHGIVRSYGWRTSRAVRIPYFIPARNLPADTPLAGSVRGLTEIIFFGRLEERKGLFEFIEAVRELAFSREGTFTVTFLGKSIQLFSPHLGRVTSHAYINSRLKGVVRFQVLSDRSSDQAIDHVSMSPAAVICLASPTDNFPNAALEMGQIPQPLVVSDTVGFHQTLSLVERTEGIFWFEPGSARSLKLQLEAALTDVGASTFSVAGRSRIQQINRRLLHERLQLIDSSFMATPEVAAGPAPLQIAYNQDADPSRTFAEALAAAESGGFEFLLSGHPLNLPGAGGQAELLEAGQQSDADLIYSSEARADQIRCCDALSIVDLLALDYDPPTCLLIRREAFAALPAPCARTVDQLHRQLLAAALTMDLDSVVLPYPLQLASGAASAEERSPVDKEDDQVRLSRFLASLPPERIGSRTLFHLVLSVQQLESSCRQIQPDTSLRSILVRLPTYLALTARAVAGRYRRALRRRLFSP